MISRRMMRSMDASRIGRKDFVPPKSFLEMQELAACQTAILPPPCLVMATTAGRTGMSGLKSGQRVDKSS